MAAATLKTSGAGVYVASPLCRVQHGDIDHVADAELGHTPCEPTSVAGGGQVYQVLCTSCSKGPAVLQTRAWRLPRKSPVLALSCLRAPGEEPVITGPLSTIREAVCSSLRGEAAGGSSRFTWWRGSCATVHRPLWWRYTGVTPRHSQGCTKTGRRNIFF